jgi:hypothetical protein
MFASMQINARKRRHAAHTRARRDHTRDQRDVGDANLLILRGSTT